jgi:hypothetical protein
MKIETIVPILGLVNLLLLLFQISTGLRWIKASLAVHRKTGITLFIIAIIHGTLAMIFA